MGTPPGPISGVGGGGGTVPGVETVVVLASTVVGVAMGVVSDECLL